MPVQPIPPQFPLNRFYDSTVDADVQAIRDAGIDPDTDVVWSPDSNAGWLLADLVTGFGIVQYAVSETLGRDVKLRIIAGYQSWQHRLMLTQRMMRIPKTLSTHLFGAALDVMIPDGLTQDGFADLISNLFSGAVRVGFKNVRDKHHVHLDFAHVLVPNVNPQEWRPGVTW